MKPMRRLGQAMALPIVLAVSAGILHASATPAQKCAVAKNKAAAKKIGAKLKCWQKAFATGATSADTACLMAAEMKFNTAIGKAEAKGGCAVTGDGNAIEGAADKCVSNIVTLTPTVTCQAANMTCPCGNGFFMVTQMCGTPSPESCSAVRAEGSNNCALNGAPPDSCATAPCTDACTGQPCG